MEKYIRSSLMNKYEFHNYGHALEILHEAFPEEWSDIQDALENLSISITDLQEAGGTNRPFRRNSMICCILRDGMRFESPATCW